MTLPVVHSPTTPPTSSQSGLVDATQTLGDSKSDLSIICAHSVVTARMEKLVYATSGLSPQGPVRLATWGRFSVLEFDGMPSGTSAVRASGSAGNAGVYETWAFGPGTFKLGTGLPAVPEATERRELSGSGGGQSWFVQRLEWLLHFPGHSYTGTSPNGGPGTADTANNLGAAGSWNRIATQRKLVKFARFVTREA